MRGGDCGDRRSGGRARPRHCLGRLQRSHRRRSGRTGGGRGRDAVLVMPPYYGTPDPQGLLQYYAQIAAATSLGVMPYARDAAVFTPELVEQLARQVPNLIAFKDGRGDVRLFQRLREHVVERHGSRPACCGSPASATTWWRPISRQAPRASRRRWLASGPKHRQSCTGSPPAATSIACAATTSGWYGRFTSCASADADSKCRS